MLRMEAQIPGLAGNAVKRAYLQALITTGSGDRHQAEL